MSRTRSSALTFFKGSTRMETSCGFSVSNSSIKRWTSGNLAFGAATIRRLEVLSVQIRICWPACVPLLEGGEPPLLGGSGLATAGDGPPLMKGGPLLLDEELLRDEDRPDDDGDEGGAGWEFKTS